MLTKINLLTSFFVIKKGGIITFSPEGTSSIFGDNQPITPGTARFLKKMNVPVYCADLCR